MRGRAILSRAEARAGTTFKPRISGYAIAAAIFASSRLLVFFAILFSVRFIPPNNLSGSWNDGSSIWHYLLRWDSGWYLAIMRGGYHYLPDSSVQQTVAFFPLYPALSWGVARLFQLPTFYRDVDRVQCGEYRSRNAPLRICSRTLRHPDRLLRNRDLQLLSSLDISLRGIFGIARDGADDGRISRAGPRPVYARVALVWIADGGTTYRHRDACAAGLLHVAARGLDPCRIDSIAARPWHRMFWPRRLRDLSGCEIQRSACLRNFSGPLVSRVPLVADPRDFFLSRSLAHIFRGFPPPSTIDPWVFVGFAAVLFVMRSQLSVSELLYAGATFGLFAITRLCQVHGFCIDQSSLDPYVPGVHRCGKIARQALATIVGLMPVDGGRTLLVHGAVRSMVLGGMRIGTASRFVAIHSCPPA